MRSFTSNGPSLANLANCRGLESYIGRKRMNHERVTAGKILRTSGVADDSRPSVPDDLSSRPAWPQPAALFIKVISHKDAWAAARPRRGASDTRPHDRP